MYFTRKFFSSSGAVLVPLFLGVILGPSASANVYPTDIKVNGSFQGTTGKSGNPVAISFILNEPASAGTTLNVFSGSTLIRTVNFAPANPGTLQGLNVVPWDGRESNGVAITAGTYTFSVTAASAGFANWTQTSSDVEPGYYVFAPRGIAVNTISNSPFYGRVYVGNAAENGSGTNAGDTQGILKANADGTLADEGQSSGGYPWVDDGFDDAPHFMRFGNDGRVYALDLTGTGIVVAFDQQITTNQTVLSEGNYQNNPFTPDLILGWGNFDVTGAGTTNGRIWLGDNDPSGAGLWSWRMTNGLVADPNDMHGTQVIATGNDLSVAASGGEMIDSHTNIFIGQDIEVGSGDDADNRVMEFTNWNGSTTLITGTKWSVGAIDDDFSGNYDVAIDSRTNPKYVAVALTSGGLRLLNASNGLVVTNGSQVLTNLDIDNDYFGVAWDAVGNLYGAGNPWRAFSPPGPNQSTTKGLGNVQLSTATIGSVAPLVTGVIVNGTNAQIFFATSPADSASVFSVQTAPTPADTFSNVTSVVTTTSTPGVFQATTSATGDAMQFYRIVQTP